MNPPALAVIVPAFNEERRLTDNLLTLLSYLQTFRPDAELIVVDDGSTDRTAELAEKLFARRPDVAARVLRFPQNHGKGYAVRAGLLATEAAIALFSDADLSTPITELPKLVGPIEADELRSDAWLARARPRSDRPTPTLAPRTRGEGFQRHRSPRDWPAVC